MTERNRGGQKESSRFQNPMYHQASRLSSDNLREKLNVSSRVSDDNAKAGQHTVLSTMPCLFAGTWIGPKWRGGKTRTAPSPSFHFKGKLRNLCVCVSVCTHVYIFVRISMIRAPPVGTQSPGCRLAPHPPQPLYLPPFPGTTSLPGAVLGPTLPREKQSQDPFICHPEAYSSPEQLF